MSTLKINTLQIGQSGTATNNFCWSQPSTPDGTVRLGNGNAGSATDILIATSSGNLGLGVTPSAWSTVVPVFQIGGGGAYLAAQGNAEVIRLGSNNYYNSGFKYVVNGYASRYDQTSGTHAWYNAPSGTAGNAISFTQAMTLDASGRLIINATSAPANASGSLNITAQSATASAINLSGRSSDNIADIFFSPNSGSSYYAYIESASTGSGELRMQAGTSGGVKLTSGATSWASLSDERKKTNLIAISDALNKVNTLRAVTGSYLDDSEATRRSFLIAQDVEKVLPEAVTSDDDGYLALRYTDTIPLLVAAIQELSAELNELKAKVNT